MFANSSHHWKYHWRKSYWCQITCLYIYQKLWRYDFIDVNQDPKVDTVFKLYQEYTRNTAESNILFSFWSTYIELVQMLMSFIRATRESNWALHLSTLKSMLPWFFATDRVNYSRYASCFWLEMNCLGNTHPCKHLYAIYYITIQPSSKKFLLTSFPAAVIFCGSSNVWVIQT